MLRTTTWTMKVLHSCSSSVYGWKFGWSTKNFNTKIWYWNIQKIKNAWFRRNKYMMDRWIWWRFRASQNIIVVYDGCDPADATSSEWHFTSIKSARDKKHFGKFRRRFRKPYHSHGTVQYNNEARKCPFSFYFYILQLPSPFPLRPTILLGYCT